MTSILVTGGTGGLGRPTVELLRSAGHEPRVLSRKPGRGHVLGDLTTGEGLDAALDGVDTVLHLATTRTAKDSAQTRRLLDAADHVGHMVFMSIVGVDRVPYAYYDDKVVSERMIEDSGIPFTILRATQFHDFVGAFFRAQRRLPVLTVVDVPDQPIAVEEVAARLLELATAAPAGRVPDIGGPEHLTLREAADAWQLAHGTRKPAWTVHLPGRMARAMREGFHMTPLPGYGTGTFAEYAAREAAK